AAQLLDPGEVEERLGDLVACGTLTALDLRPGLGVQLHVRVWSSQGLQHPAGASLGAHRPNAPSAYRTALTSAGFGSSAAKAPSMYGGRLNAADWPCMTLIAQRLWQPSVVFGGLRSPTRSQ